MWENIMLCQFHDCLPGSSIEMCYDDSDKLYAANFKTGEKLLKEALATLGYARFDPSEGRPISLNTLPWHRTETVQEPLPGNFMVIANGIGAVPVERAATDTEGAFVRETEPGIFVMHNSDYNVTVQNGAILSLYDRRAERELIPEGQKANQFVIFDDKPLYWQAWDVEVFHLESRKELTSGETRIGDSAPGIVSLVTETQISDKSWVKTTMKLSCSSTSNHVTSKEQSSYLEFECEVEWHETMKFLKVEFPVDITNTEASYETQYGIIRRPTHYNTSWDMAKFEVCCHKWADLSEHNYGVSILNDSKYGFAICGNLMRLSLLRAPKAPDAHADMGKSKLPLASSIDPSLMSRRPTPNQICHAPTRWPRRCPHRPHSVQLQSPYAPSVPFRLVFETDHQVRPAHGALPTDRLGRADPRLY